MTREEEIVAALTAVEPPAPKWLHRGFTAAEAKSFEQRIDKIVGLLAPPPERREQCRQDVGWRVGHLLSVTRAAEHGITHHGPTKKATAAYVDLLQQLQAGSRKYAAARGRLLIAQDVVDRMVEIGERALANGVATPPRLEWQAVELAHGLLVNLGRRPTKVSCLSRWHKVAAAMLGVDNEKVDLRRQMDACLKVARERQK